MLMFVCLQKFEPIDEDAHEETVQVECKTEFQEDFELIRSVIKEKNEVESSDEEEDDDGNLDGNDSDSDDEDDDYMDDDIVSRAISKD